MSDADDTAIRAGIIERRQDALATAYQRHSGAVLALARRVLRAEALAEEVVQEVFVRLWNSPERFDPARGSLRSFLLADTHGRSVDLLRSETARRRREDKEAVRAPVTVATVEEEVWVGELGAQVRSALGALDESERTAIGLAYFGGHSYREVASILGVPEGTIKSRIRAGLGRLRMSLDSLSPEAGGEA